MKSKTAKWGNSIGVRIPREVARKAHIGIDSTVEIENSDEGIIIKPESRPEYTLKELVKGITANNRHKEIDLGLPVGKEVI